jgi:cell division septum initiation protein DivIVA
VTEAVDPDHLEQIEFPVVRRGVDPDAVRSTLAEAADGLRLLRRRCHELEHRIEALEAQIPDPDQLEHDREAARVAGRAEGAAQGEQERNAARSEAEAIVTEAKEEGRRLVNEAQTVRRRMLEDLGRRRRALRQQIEQLQGGRERLLEAYEVVGHTMREATEELTVALPEARAAAERAGHGVGPGDTVEHLEAEIASARMAGLPIVTAEDEPNGEEPPRGRRRPVAVPLERDVRDMREVEPVVADFEEVRVLAGDSDDEAAEGEVDEPEPGAGESDGDEDAGAAAPAGDEPDADELDEHGPDAGAIDESGPDAGVVDEPEPEPGLRGGEHGATTEADGRDGEDLFARLRRSRQDAPASGDEPEVVPAAAGDGADGEETPAATDAEPRATGEVDADGGADAEADAGRGGPDLDQPDDGAEPFGLVIGSPSEPTAPEDARAGRSTAEHELARRLKRLLSDEQNDVLDRLRRNRRRTLTVEDLLDDFDERVTRFADAVRPVLAEAAATTAGEAALPVDDLAAELAREVAEALVDGLLEPLEEDLPVEDLDGPVRALYRDWKTDRIGALAERYVEAACEPAPPAV